MNKEELQKQIDDLELQLKPLQEEQRKLYLKTEEEVDAKIKRCHQLKDQFNEDELLFAAYVRCPCGAGMAYPKGIGGFGAWDCSAILLGKADKDKTHEATLPFAFYNIKSEGQPSANGATTR